MGRRSSKSRGASADPLTAILPFPGIMGAPPAVPAPFESNMMLRRLRLTTLVPCVGVGVLLLPSKVTGLLSALLLVAYFSYPPGAHHLPGPPASHLVV